MSHLVHTTFAIREPDVDHHYLAPKITQSYGFAIDSLQGEIRSALAYFEADFRYLSTSDKQASQHETQCYDWNRTPFVFIHLCGSAPFFLVVVLRVSERMRSNYTSRQGESVGSVE